MKIRTHIYNLTQFSRIKKKNIHNVNRINHYN